MLASDCKTIEVFESILKVRRPKSDWNVARAVERPMEGGFKVKALHLPQL